MCRLKAAHRGHLCRRPTSNPCQPGTSCARCTASRHLHHSSSLRSTNKHPTSCQLHHKLWGCLQHQGCSTTAKTLNTTDKWLGAAAACYCHMLAGFIAAGQQLRSMQAPAGLGSSTQLATCLSPGRPAPGSGSWLLQGTCHWSICGCGSPRSPHHRGTSG